ncbi:MAG: PAS domain S-box protein [bacterium]|nr:PAS domain S-box protein [bacterium]
MQSKLTISFSKTMVTLHIVLPIVTGLMAALGVYFGLAGSSVQNADDPAGTGFSSDKRARAVIRYLPAAAITLDMKGRITFHNPAASDLFGVDLDQEQEQIAAFLQSADLAFSMEEIRAGKTVIMEKNWPHPDTPGVDRTWKISGAPVLRNGETAEVLLLLEDITPFRKMEDELIRSEDRYRNIFNHAPCGIFFVDSEGNYLDANPAALKMLGYSLEELVKLNTRELSADSDRRLGRLRETSGWIDEETRYLSKGGKVVETQLTASSYQSGNETYFIGIAKDVTARRELERSLAAARARLKAVLSLESRPLILLDGEDKVANVNKPAAEMLRCDPDQLLGMPLVQIIGGAIPVIQDPAAASATVCTFQIPGAGSRQLSVLRLPLGSSRNPGSLLVLS